MNRNNPIHEMSGFSQAPESFSRIAMFRWAVDKRSDAHPVLQQAWQGSNGTLQWENVPTEVIE